MFSSKRCSPYRPEHQTCLELLQTPVLCSKLNKGKKSDPTREKARLGNIKQTPQNLNKCSSSCDQWYPFTTVQSNKTAFRVIVAWRMSKSSLVKFSKYYRIDLIYIEENKREDEMMNL